MKKNKKIFISFFFLFLGIVPNFIFLSSCKKHLSFSIKYGDTINCLDSKKNNYVSIENLKNAIKKNFVVSPQHEFENNEFEQLSENVILKDGDYSKRHTLIEEMYFEIIMSLIEHEKKGFQLKWNCSNKYIFNNVEIINNSNEKNVFISAQYIQKDKNIYLNLSTKDGVIKSIKSYKFKHCLVK